MFLIEELEAEAEKTRKPDMSKTTLKHELKDELQKFNTTKVKDDLAFIDFRFSPFPPKPEISERKPKSGSAPTTT